MRPLSPTQSLARNEQGFSLIELLVSMLSATVVAGALFAVLNFSTSETSTLAYKVQSDQLGRIAMTRVIDELHSSCLSPGFAPIQEKSNGTELYFINAYSKEAVIPGAELHRIVWEASTKTLVDYSVKSNGGESPNFTFPTTKPTTGTQIATNVTEIGTTPIFQYFKYAEETSESETAPTSTLNPTALADTPELKTADAEAASVLVSFNMLPSNGKEASGKTVNSLNISNQITFAFSVPNAETPIHDAPCQ